MSCCGPGPAHVVAVDVGYGQLAWSLRSDPRVTVLDRVNVRALTPEQVAPAPTLVTADLSFISLALVLPALAACAAAGADFVAAGQAAVRGGQGAGRSGRGRQGSGAPGRSRRPPWRAAALVIGLGVRGVTASPLPGPSGNVEYFLWLRRGAPALDPAALLLAIAEGPQ